MPVVSPGLGFEKNIFLCLTVKIDLGKFYSLHLQNQISFNLGSESKILTQSNVGCWCTFSIMFNKLGILKFLYS